MWICSDCGNKYGEARGRVATFHIGLCEWCGKEKAVTEDRDYGYPKLPKKGKENERDKTSTETV